MPKANWIPDGYHNVTPYLIVSGASQAIEFYKKAFGAEELFRCLMPDGKSIGHAEIRIGDSIVMVADECKEMGYLSPQSVGGNPTGLHLYVPDVDKTFQRAVAAGAKAQEPLADKFYGDRSGTVIDPFGHRWTVGTHQEDLTAEEVQRRADALFGPGKKQ